MKTINADPRHVDTGAPGSLGVAADRIDVPSEGRPLGDEREHEQRCDHQEQDEGDAAVAIADHDDENGCGRDGDELGDQEPRVADGDAVPPARDHVHTMLAQ